MLLFLTSFVGEVEQRKTLGELKGIVMDAVMDLVKRVSKHITHTAMYNSSLWKNSVDIEDPVEILTPAFINLFSN